MEDKMCITLKPIKVQIPVNFKKRLKILISVSCILITIASLILFYFIISFRITNLNKFLEFFQKDLYLKIVSFIIIFGFIFIIVVFKMTSKIKMMADRENFEYKFDGNGIQIIDPLKHNNILRHNLWNSIDSITFNIIDVNIYSYRGITFSFKEDKQEKLFFNLQNYLNSDEIDNFINQLEFFSSLKVERSRSFINN